MKRTQILMNKSVYLGLSKLEISKTVIKPKYGVKSKACYTDTDNFIVYTKARRHLSRHCKECRNKISYFKL